MEICQHCGMYMKPTVNRIAMNDSLKIKVIASCEFCGQHIASGFEGEKWERVSTPLAKQPSETPQPNVKGEL